MVLLCNTSSHSLDSLCIHQSYLLLVFCFFRLITHTCRLCFAIPPVFRGSVFVTMLPEIDFISGTWLSFINNSGLSDRMIFVLGNTAIVYLLFWPINILLYFSYQYDFPGKKRFLIQPGLKPDPELVKKNIKENIVSHIFVVPLLSAGIYDIFVYFGMKMRQPLPSMPIILRDLAVAIFFADLLGYWLHRILHQYINMFIKSIMSIK